MRKADHHLAYLFRQYLAGNLDAAERRQFLQIIAENQSEDEFKTLIDAEIARLEPEFAVSVHGLTPEQADIIFDHITSHQPFVQTVPIQKRRWVYWIGSAAAVLILVMAGIYYFNGSGTPEMARPVAAAPVQDVAPGKTGAILTLSNGEKMLLDSLHNGTIVKDGSALTKDNNGLVYTYGKGQTTVSYHTLSTPRAYQYHLTLPDGTKVWLNAESSITYPTVFTGKERKVTVTGETYFEVVENKQQPFYVHYGGKWVEVVGTHFNVNAYTEETDSRVTLLQGSVHVYNGTGSGVLKPGQQAIISKTSEAIRVTDDVDTDQVMAWKNGHFDFRETDLKTLMRQLMRWYDVEVEYQKGVPERYFTADISRNKNLKAVLDILELNKIHFRIENKKIIVTP